MLERRILEEAAARISPLLFSAEPLVSVFLRSLGRGGVGHEGFAGGARVSLKELPAPVHLLVIGSSGGDMDFFDDGSSTEVNLGVLEFKFLELIPLELAEPALRCRLEISMQTSLCSFLFEDSRTTAGLKTNVTCFGVLNLASL